MVMRALWLYMVIIYNHINIYMLEMGYVYMMLYGYDNILF